MQFERNKLGIFRLSEAVEVPRFATKGSAAFDLRVYLDGSPVEAWNEYNESVLVEPGEDEKLSIFPGFRYKLPTGLIMDIPEGYWLQCSMRSGTALKNGLIMVNSPGVVDWDYTQELFTCVLNTTKTIVTVENGERIAQAMLKRCVPCEIEDLLEPPGQKTERAGGFNSTGLK